MKPFLTGLALLLATAGVDARDLTLAELAVDDRDQITATTINHWSILKDWYVSEGMSAEEFAQVKEFKKSYREQFPKKM